MNREDVIVGMKVVPHSKSVFGYGDLENSHFWKQAKQINQPYLFVTGIRTDKIILDINNNKDHFGDFFLPEDFELYIERNVKMKKSELNSSMLFKMRDGKLYVLMPDQDNDLTFYNKEGIKQGYCDDNLSLDDYDEDLSPENEAYDIVAIKQRNTCARVIADVLGNEEPEEWDWVEEVENNEPKVEESQTPIINNITINLTLDPNNDPAHFLKQINDAIKKNGLVFY